MDRIGDEWDESESPAIEQFKKMGYEYKTFVEIKQEDDNYDTRDPIINTRLRKAIRNFNPGITESQIDESIIKLTEVPKTDTDPKVINEIFHSRLFQISRDSPFTPVQIELANGEREDVNFFNFNEPEKNDFLIVNQVRVNGRKESIIPDLVVYINGIPIALIECKSPFISSPLNEAKTKNVRKYRDATQGWEKLMYYNQVVVVTSGQDSQYAPTYENSLYQRWTLTETNMSKEEIEFKFGKTRSQEILFAEMFSKNTLIDILKNYLIFENGEKRIVGYQQYRAIKKSFAKLKSSELTPLERGGIIWHTQGSGKSLTMVWFAIQLRENYKNPTILLVTDRVNLDDQITKVFNQCNYPSPIQMPDSADLRDYLVNHKGSTIMTTVHKFHEKQAKNIVDDEVFVLVDEAHRTQNKILATGMRQILGEKAIFYAYTGTPLLVEKKKTTIGAFGNYIDKYKQQDAEKDRRVLPIVYQSRLADTLPLRQKLDNIISRVVPDVDEREKIIKKYSSEKIIIESTERIRVIAEDIIEHFNSKIMPNGTKALIVASSRTAAIKYYEAINELGGPDTEIVMTWSEPEYDPEMHEKIKKYMPPGDEKKARKTTTENFLNPGGTQILIVVDMLLTGFNAPILQAMYLDDSIKHHSVLQAVARTNRNYSQSKKEGLIIDYQSNLKNIKDAYELYSDDDVENLVKNYDILNKHLMDSYDKVFELISKDDLHNKNSEKIISLLIDSRHTAQFDTVYGNFARALDSSLPDPNALKYVDDFKLLTKLRIALKNKLSDDVSISPEYGDKVRKLIDLSLKNESMIQIIPKTPLHVELFNKQIDGTNSNKTKTIMMKNRAKRCLEAWNFKNPVLYSRLSDELNNIIGKLREKKYQDQEILSELRLKMNELFDSRNDYANHGYRNEFQYALGLELEAKGCVTPKETSFIINDNLKVFMNDLPNWKYQSSSSREMRKKILELLVKDENLSVESIENIAHSVVDTIVPNHFV